MKTTIPTFFLICTLLTSCSALFFGTETTADPHKNYDYLCEIIDTRYSLFNIKKNDWESSKKEYRKLLRDSMNDEELLEVFDELVGSLEDGHSNVYTSFNYTRHWDWYLDFPVNFNFEIIERNYLGRKHWRTGPFLHTILEDSIGYVYYGSFSPSISGKQLKAVFGRMNKCKAVIFDIRNNGGGKLSNVKRIARQFADSTRSVHSFYFKNGPGKEDFSKAIGYTVKPAKNAFTKPVVILMNRKSYSAATFFPAAMRAFPHVTIMGDQSGGGGGIPYHFELPNGWSFRISTTRTISALGENIEPGILPDIRVHLSEEDLKNGKDTMIERAMAFLNQKEE